ncbi:MAG TPA: phenylalanine--tRNA ligase subunit alpha, partial [Methanobacteriaceae archaeon]|nr:phenylalanine--tRNA ligase subunit alpha [Methanobacteriaceae archaeon]
QVTISKHGKRALEEAGPDENLLSKLEESGELSLQELSPRLQEGFNLLKQRKGLLKVHKKPSYTLEVTTLGKEILEDGVEIREEATQITHEQLKSGSWRN